MKVIDNIKAVNTGNRREVKHIVEPLYSIALESTDVLSPVFAREYAIIVRLGASQWIAEDLIKKSKGEVINHAIEHMKRAVVEELYGELRKDLFDLQMEMRNERNYYDTPSLKKLAEIMEKISL